MDTPIPRILLAAAALAAVLLWQPPAGEGDPRPRPPAPDAPLPARAAAAAPSAPHSPPPAPAAGTGRTEPIVDIAEEDARARDRYRQRIEGNILRLEEAADRARADGDAARAALMEKRIDGLLRRLGEAEAPDAPG